MFILEKVSNKRGDALIFSMIMVTMAMVFTILIVDIGMAFITKTQIQIMADAAVTGGANRGKDAFYSPRNNRKRTIVDERVAKPQARRIINENKRHLPSGMEVSSVQYNPTRRIDGETLGWRDQYYSGNFTVRVNGRHKTMFLDQRRFNATPRIPYFNFQVDSRVKIRAK